MISQAKNIFSKKGNTIWVVAKTVKVVILNFTVKDALRMGRSDVV